MSEMDADLDRRPAWNCTADADGPHYLAGGTHCRWCGKGPEQIAADFEARMHRDCRQVAGGTDAHTHSGQRGWWEFNV